MKINFIFINKTNEQYVKIAIEKYSKILKKYFDFKIIELKENSVDKIVSSFQKNSFKIFLDLKGKDLSSEEMAKKFQNWQNQGFSKFDILIGDRWGIPEELQDKANFLWKISNLTFNHQLIRVIILEQIYRIFSIIAGEKYHN